MNLNDILQIALKANASDVHLKAGLKPTFRIDGSLVPLNNMQPLTPEELSKAANELMTPQQKLKFQDFSEVDLAYGVPGLGRFRANIFVQRGTIGMVLRVIPTKIRSIEELHLPPSLNTICEMERGLVIVTGATGSGKSTTLAALVDRINTTRSAHILTIEEPIEYLIRDQKSIINQREIGVDSVGFNLALRAALRQDPDVILVGEMRDPETMETALAAAETGHLVLTTLHTLDASESINRIVSAFPPHQHKQIRLQLGSILRAVISQRLVPRKDDQGRVAAVEVMFNNARIRELIENEDRTRDIATTIAESYTTFGMQSFDQSLMQLLKSDIISLEEALRQASNPADFSLRLSGVSGTSDANWGAFDGSHSSAEQANDFGIEIDRTSGGKWKTAQGAKDGTKGQRNPK